MAMRKTIRSSRLFMISVMVIMLTSLLITGICAYFTFTDFRENTVSMGNNEISITEAFSNPDIKTGEITTITKRVEINNTGINCAGVRVRTEFSEKEILDWASADYNTADWEKNGDYWYYRKALRPGEKTEPLFNSITCSNPSAEQVKNFEIYVYAESRCCDPDISLSGIKNLFA